MGAPTSSSKPMKLELLQTALDNVRKLQDYSRDVPKELYTPAIQDIQPGCRREAITCFIAELDSLDLFRPYTDEKAAREVQDFIKKIKKDVLTAMEEFTSSGECVECEVHEMKNGVEFLEGFVGFLQCMNQG